MSRHGYFGCDNLVQQIQRMAPVWLSIKTFPTSGCPVLCLVRNHNHQPAFCIAAWIFLSIVVVLDSHHSSILFLLIHGRIFEWIHL